MSLLHKFSVCSAGYGVVAEKEFRKGDFLVEYKGDLIQADEAARREKLYAKKRHGCFMFFFKHNGHTMWYVYVR